MGQAVLHPSIVVVPCSMLGLAMAHHPTLLSGFARIQGDPGDTRLNNYVLEHGYRWLSAAPGHERFWSPPIFYPAPNTAAYSDILLGVAPFYWFWRLVGLEADTAFQCWTLTVSSLNIVAAY